MKAVARGEGRQTRGSVGARSFWLAVSIVVVFNFLFVTWVLLKPGD